MASTSSSSLRQKGEMSSGGYSAGKESVEQIKSPAPPCLIDLNPKHKRKAPQVDADETDRKRRIREENYNASTVEANLRRAGCQYPPLMKMKPRVNPHLNCSMVHHIYSSAAEKSPFLNVSINGDTFSDLSNDHAVEEARIYQGLLSAAIPFYNECRSGKTFKCKRSASPIGSDGDNSDGTTSSVSDNESEDCTNSSVVVIHARLDDGLPTNAPVATLQEKQRMTQIISCSPSASISLEEAVGVCAFPRMVTTANPPYQIIFANGSYGALTGLASDETLGKRLNEIVSKPSTLSLADCAAMSSMGGQYASIDKMLHLTDLKMKVTPIVSSRTETSPFQVTHFALDIITDPTLSLSNHGRRHGNASTFSEHVTQRTAMRVTA